MYQQLLLSGTYYTFQWRRKMFFDGGPGLQFFKDTELNFQHKTPFGKD